MIPRVAHIYRHTIKSHGREAMEWVNLEAGKSMPWDRTWAVAHEQSKADGSRWVPCANFSRVSKAPGLMAVTSTLNVDDETVTLNHPDQESITVHPERDEAKLVAWAQRLMPENRAKSARVVRVQDRGLTDTDFPSVTIGSLSSVSDLSARMGVDISHLRFRMNFWIEGLPAWEELDWVGRDIRIGSATLRIRERTLRCNSTLSNPETGKADADVLSALKEGWGHQDFGIAAEVIHDGRICVGDPLETDHES